MKITWVLLFVRSIARQHPTEPAKAKAGDTTHAATAHRTAPAAADPEVLGRFLVELADASHKHQPRVDEYKGHRIAIETHYEITVDGTPVPVHLTVGNDGDVHCHALPAYEFVSAVDMVHVLIDTYPDDFPAVPGPAGGTRDRRGGTALGWRGAEMAVVRRNILTNPDVRHAYVHGVLLLKQQETSFLTSAYNIPGTAVPVRAYDLFVIWHHKTMKTPVPPDGDSGTRNAAHRGPVFLPWHRLMLRFMELNLQRVLEDPTFGLPYWDWTVDGSPAADGSPPAPASSLIWDKKWMGGQGDPVNIGPFAFDAGFRVRIESDVGLALRQVDRGLRRSFGQPPPVGSPTLPSGDDLRAAFDTQATPSLGTYDVPPWDKSSGGFRNRLEGFKGTGLHNQVHRWVNGDMAPAHSPNDPVFFLHHCNVDRIWEGWMRRHGRVYLPDMTESDTLKGHRIDDPIVSPLGKDGTPGSVLDQTAEVTYDGLP